jgi:hypothetical protein
MPAERSWARDRFVRAEVVVGQMARMNDAEQPTPERYREAAERLRQLAAESQFPDIIGDLLDLSARFERMAAYLEAASRPSREG